MKFVEEIQQILQQEVKNLQKADRYNESIQAYLEIEKEDLLAICTVLKNNAELYFDSLSCITAIDLGEKENRMEVIYEFYSIPFNHRLGLKVTIERDETPMPSVESLCSLWRTADWHEREAYDLVGVYFNNHPDLRRILMPEDWEGHPLRKDYSTQETYHGIKVDY